ncbi:hypothetical protein [Streptomyces sp. 8L]|uniref:hypothetical protein n=1 Tax=Streptomyces sp. 8L TaxID=2877242 RepID=UPI001CD4E2A8|nr:hypothetical protein [Streptomyces sp. 8L]MCA1219213.1 hypothetical protein [Streptomyces sp. 8L]
MTTLRRTVQGAVLAAALLSASAVAGPTAAHAAALPPACQDALLKTLDKFPVAHFTVPDKVESGLLDQVSALSDADQSAFTQAACTSWNDWATANGKAVAKDLDTTYQNTSGKVCAKFAAASLKTLKKYAPNVPAATRDLEKVAKKVWKKAMQKLSTDATDATCRKAYDGVKSGW